MFDIVARKVETMAGSVGKAARSMVIRAGASEMVPRRDMRRPFWSMGAVNFSGLGDSGVVD